MKIKVVNARSNTGLSVKQIEALEAFNDHTTVATFRELYAALFGRWPDGEESFFALNEQVAERMREYGGNRTASPKLRFSWRTLFAYMVAVGVNSTILQAVQTHHVSPAWMLAWVGFWIPACWSQWKDFTDGQ